MDYAKKQNRPLLYFVLAIAFYWAVTCFDVGYCVANRHNFEDWEMNPIMLHVYTAYGLTAILVWKLLTLLYVTVIMAICYALRLYWPIHLVTIMHVLLLAVYLM